VSPTGRLSLLPCDAGTPRPTNRCARVRPAGATPPPPHHRTTANSSSGSGFRCEPLSPPAKQHQQRWRRWRDWVVVGLLLLANPNSARACPRSCGNGAKARLQSLAWALLPMPAKPVSPPAPARHEPRLHAAVVGQQLHSSAALTASRLCTLLPPRLHTP